MIIQREVDDYQQYIYAQGRKAREQAGKLIAAKDKRIRQFINVFDKIKPHMTPGPVLCLGARTGCEVEAAIIAGFAGSVGIDLHPIGKDVIEADWHKMPFGSGAFPNIFTNSLDHAADFYRLADEIRRVLAPGGRFVFSATDRSTMKAEHWTKKPNNEYLFWANPDELRDKFQHYGFIPRHREAIGRNVVYVMGI
jgi:SAM-dependent methyltransferase